MQEEALNFYWWQHNRCRDRKKVYRERAAQAKAETKEKQKEEQEKQQRKETNQR